MIDQEQTPDIEEDTTADLGDDATPESEISASPEEEQEQEDVVSFDDDEPEDNDQSKLIKDLRRRHRRAVSKGMALEAKVKEYEAGNPQPDAPMDPGPVPTIEDANYDQSEHSKRIEEWAAKRDAYRQHQAETQQRRQKEKEYWDQRMADFEERKKQLKVKNYQDYEDDVFSTLNTTQRGVIIHASDNPALMVYALGKSPKKLAEMAEIKDPVKFAFAAAKLETKLKIDKRKPVTKPEQSVTGTGPMSGTLDSELNRLRAEAEKSGNYSKVMEYRRRRKRAAG